MVTGDSKVKFSLSATPLCDLDYVANELEASNNVKPGGYTRYLFFHAIGVIDNKSNSTI